MGAECCLPRYIVDGVASFFFFFFHRKGQPGALYGAGGGGAILSTFCITGTMVLLFHYQHAALGTKGCILGKALSMTFIA